MTGSGNASSKNSTSSTIANPLPSITTQPASQTVIAGQSATFSMSASGVAPLSYQWRKNGTSISGATSTTYTTPTTTTTDSGSQFTVVVRNSAASVTSNVAALTVDATGMAPSIILQPVSQSVTAGQTATFSVSGSGAAPLSYQWKKNGTSISGATSFSYTTPVVSVSDSRSQFIVVVSNSVGNVTSKVAILKILASFNISPLQPSAAIGSKVQLNALANYLDGSTQDVTSSVTWTSSDPRKLSVSSSGVAEGLATGIVAVSGDYNGQHASTNVSISIGDIPWSGPIVITSGGTYSGNWESTDPNVTAVIVNTKDPVIIENSHIRGPSTLISARAAAGDLTVRNTAGLALNPNVLGLPNGLFVDASFPARLVVENCYMENTRYGVRVSGYGGNRDGNQTITIRYNRGRNMTGLLSDGQGGQLIIKSTLSQGSNSYRKFSHFVQLEKVQAVPGIDIGWNEVIDEPYKSNVDDVINIYQTSGTPNSMLMVHDSYIQGAYPYDPTIDHYSGGGIITDGTGSDTPATATSYSSFHDNQVVSTTNYGIQFATGHNNEAFNNRIIASGLLANGAKITLQNVGMVDEDSYRTNVGNKSMYGNSMHDNTIGWMCWLSTCASNGYRNDMYLPLNSNDKSANLSFQANPITLAMEEGEYQAWLQKIQTNAVTIGPTF